MQKFFVKIPKEEYKKLDEYSSYEGWKCEHIHKRGSFEADEKKRKKFLNKLDIKQKIKWLNSPFHHNARKAYCNTIKYKYYMLSDCFRALKERYYRIKLLQKFFKALKIFMKINVIEENIMEKRSLFKY